jgi:DNA invertase Pin-like site-specific DNA recombinase
VVKVYTDYVSGGTSDRTQFQQMFEDARKKKFDAVVFWALDRFSREGVRATLNHLELLNSYGVDFVSFQEQYIDSCGMFKDAVISILSTLAMQMKVLQSERVLAGLRKSRELYGRIGGRPRISEEKIKKALELCDLGYSNRAIGKMLEISYNTVKRYRDTAGMESKKVA